MNILETLDAKTALTHPGIFDWIKAEQVEQLIKRGADTQAMCSDGTNVVERAQAYGRDDLMAIMLGR